MVLGAIISCSCFKYVDTCPSSQIYATQLVVELQLQKFVTRLPIIYVATVGEIFNVISLSQTKL